MHGLQSLACARKELLDSLKRALNRGTLQPTTFQGTTVKREWEEVTKTGIGKRETPRNVYIDGSKGTYERYSVHE